MWKRDYLNEHKKTEADSVFGAPPKIGGLVKLYVVTGLLPFLNVSIMLLGKIFGH
jgi:hypothetical protein